MLDPRPYWNFDDPAATEVVFRDLLENTTDAVDRVVIQTQIARALGLQGKFDEGMDLIDSVADVDHTTLSWRAIEMGRLHRSKGELEPAGANFILAMSQSDQEEEPNPDQVLESLHFDAMHMYALVLSPADQIEFTKESLRKISDSTNPLVRRWSVTFLNNLGMAYTEIGDWQSAYAAFLDAQGDARQLGDPNRIFPARYMVGWALRNLDRRDEALAHMEALQHDLAAAGRSDQYVAAELAILRGEKTD